MVCRYELRKLRGDGSLAPAPPAPRPGGPAPRATTTTERIVRITEVARRVKAMYGNTCQVCGEAVMIPAGPYVEASHIRPLGRPHDGPDTEANVLSLCPNDVRFDTGSIDRRRPPDHRLGIRRDGGAFADSAGPLDRRRPPDVPPRPVWANRPGRMSRRMIPTQTGVGHHRMADGSMKGVLVAA